MPTTYRVGMGCAGGVLPATRRGPCPSASSGSTARTLSLIRTNRPGYPALTASAIRKAAWAGVRCVVSTTSASLCSHVRAASA
jgi:hypothetical protein